MFYFTVNCIDFPNPFSKKNKPESKPTPNATGTITNAQSLTNTVQKVKDCYEDYTELGCFANIAPWHSILRPFPTPMSPKDIDAKIYLYTR